ncbi:uncharacterized protein VICG_00167 [Vittaforma corneae ATCC 50505]|uniref:2Fe-2S ferredoxin-type domain-containing protein n=1 Tax=Vittaforma corneae (strain ATCC 50505) TaxID=993615 RepID=L2GR97_VITCO|nr:uncharacterized protein VICG_00167 [Vittaforma corneae ATCC 50505]ELA42852.1 hypothetical protein VICG_00167 [Vittaforma corneae ATCC 50505]
MALERVKNTVNIFFKHLDKIFKVQAEKGKSLLHVAHANNVPLEGACEGNLACSTCHVVCDKSVFREEEISERENDLLDLAYGLKPTSRLGCQVVVDDYMKDKTFEIPRATRNLAVDGYRPPIH